MRFQNTYAISLLESAYRECLSYELIKAGLSVEKEKPLPLVCEEITMDYGYRIDILVETKVVIQLQVVEALNDA